MKEKKTFKVVHLIKSLNNIQKAMNAETIRVKLKITTRLFNITLSILNEMQKIKINEQV